MSRSYDVGVQSFTYREFDVEGLCSELEDTGVTAVELCHEHVTSETKDEKVDEIREQLADAGLDVCGYGVVDFEESDDEESIRETFSMVERLGGEYCSLEFPPGDAPLRERLLEIAHSFEIELPIHNHGPDATYSTVEDVMEVLDASEDPLLGACVDTGHFYRSGQSPEDVIPVLGDRVLALHLKDFHDTETEAVAGEGQLDVRELLELLDEETSLSQPLVVEYEADAANPTPAVVEAVEAVQRAMQ
jgi:sugar phosphate isomerase/epimerase